MLGWVKGRSSQARPALSHTTQKRRTKTTARRTHPQVPERQHAHDPQHDAQDAPAHQRGGMPVAPRQERRARQDGREREEDVRERDALCWLIFGLVVLWGKWGVGVFWLLVLLWGKCVGG